MKYTLTLLILCFAFVAKAQNQIGVSLSGGIDFTLAKEYSINQSSFSNPDLGVNYFIGIRYKKFSPSFGIEIKSYTSRYILYRGLYSHSTGGINFPVDCWYRFNTSTAKVQFGMSCGLFALINYGVGERLVKAYPDFYSPCRDLYSTVSTNFGGQAGVYTILFAQNKKQLLINPGISFVPSLKNQLEGNYDFWGYKSFFLKAEILFGK